jgi:hypothetical protein
MYCAGGTVAAEPDPVPQQNDIGTIFAAEEDIIAEQAGVANAATADIGIQP